MVSAALAARSAAVVAPQCNRNATESIFGLIPCCIQSDDKYDEIYINIVKVKSCLVELVNPRSYMHEFWTLALNR